MVLLGDGDGNVKDILTSLDKAGYKGFLSLEPHLSDFFGFKVLEKGETQKKEMDGIIAYRMSYNRLKDMLETK